VRSALKTITAKPQLRERLWENANRLYKGLADLGYEVGPHVSPVVPVMVGTKEQGLQFWRALIEQGVYVNLVLPPASPAGVTLVRCSVSASHTPEQIEQIIQAFSALLPSLGPDGQPA
jgi:8-amino-7-oxononanoate synthase